MILLLNTSTPFCELFLVDGETTHDGSWQADRTLARDLLGRIDTLLSSHGADWRDITGIGVYEGPGSFTGLRIGLTVVNTIADTQSLPIVGVTGESWRTDACSRLAAGDNDHIVMPVYGGDANITTPRK